MYMYVTNYIKPWSEKKQGGGWIKTFLVLLSTLIYYFWLSFIYFRVLLRNARKLAQSYYLSYQENIPTAQIVHKIANVMQEYTQSG